MIDAFFAKAGWSFIREASPNPPLNPGQEVLLWRDPVGPLSVARLQTAGRLTLRLRLSNEIVLDVIPDLRRVVEMGASLEIAEDTRIHFLADQVLPRIMAHDGSLVLHAGAVRHHDGCMVFVGESGFGKSSLTASFDQAGRALMGDDALLISTANKICHARAVYPSLRLFPDSVKAVLSEGARTASVANYTPKLRVEIPLAADLERDKFMPIKAIFVLAGPGQIGAIELRPATPASCCMALIRNSFALDPTDTQCARKRLQHASQLSASVPAYEITYPHAYEQLPRVREAILSVLDS